jgi:hypothetical protein
VAWLVVNSNSAIATAWPSGALRWVVILFCGAAGAASIAGALADDGEGDPVQIAGVVPGTDDACWGDEHALTNAAKDAKKDVVATATLR